MNPRIDIANDTDFERMRKCIKNAKHDMRIMNNDFTCITCNYRIVETVNKTIVIVRFE